MRFLLTSTFLIFIISSNAFAQPERIGAGLSFANTLEFNNGETSNPGVFLKTWISLDKKRKVHLVPSVTAYNKYKYDPGTFILKNYMFQGDIDGQYVVFREKTVKVIGYAGANFTYLYSTFSPTLTSYTGPLSDAKDWAIGGNIGAGLELRMASRWDFIVSGKYKVSRYPQFIISVNAAYFFRDRDRTYRRR